MSMIDGAVVSSFDSNKEKFSNLFLSSEILISQNGTPI
jgi:hypothetical protein